MTTQIFVSQPVDNFEASKDFFSKLGYTFNPQFSDENGACIVISDTIYLMLVARTFFQTFTKKEVVDASKAVERSITLSAESKDAVNEMVAKALSLGATLTEEATDYGFMYMHGFDDLDGHHWEYMWMDPNGMPEQQK